MPSLNLLFGDGVFYAAMAAIAVVSMAFLLERIWTLFFVMKDTSSELMPQIEAGLREADPIRSLKVINGRSGLLVRVLEDTLPGLTRGEAAYRQLVRTSLAKWIPLLSRRAGYFSVFANVAMLLGLLGTIFGLIRSFQAVSVADPASKQQVLASGISLAMNTTALGLIIAIPILLAGVFINQRIRAEVSRVEAALERVILVAFFQGK